MAESVARRTIIVTGSNKGVGRGIIDNLAAKVGYSIIMAVRSVARGEQAKSEILANSPNA